MIGSAEIEAVLAEHADARAAVGSEPQPGAAPTWPVPADAPAKTMAPPAPPHAWCWDPFALLPRVAG